MLNSGRPPRLRVAKSASSAVLRQLPGRDPRGRLDGKDAHRAAAQGPGLRPPLAPPCFWPPPGAATQTTQTTTIHSKKQLCKIQDLAFKIANYNSICFPQMLKFIANCDNTNLAGSSGGPILMDGKILGLISGQIENRIQIIPFIFLRKPNNQDSYTFLHLKTTT